MPQPTFSTVKALAAERSDVELFTLLALLERVKNLNESGRMIAGAMADVLVDRFGIRAEYAADLDSETDSECIIKILATQAA